MLNIRTITEAAYRALGAILDIVKVLTVTNDDVLNAYITRAPDFEDCLLATCAKSKFMEDKKDDFTGY